MSSISLSQVGTSKTISYSWSTIANTSYIFGIDGTQVESGHGDTSGSGTYTVDSYGSHSASLWVAHGDDPSEYITQSITLTPPTVTCTKNVYYDGSFSTSETESGLTPGYTFTPESHIPSYDSTHYRFVSCSPSGTMTCPDNDFSVNYYFVSTVTCSIYANYDGQYIEPKGSQSVNIGQKLAATAFKPVVADMYQYEDFSTSATSYTSSTITVPNYDFYITYNYSIRNRITLTIKADKNGTDEVISTQTVYEGLTLTVADYEPTIENYEYTGEWTTTASSYTTTTVTVPSSAFSIIYKFKPISIVYIYATKNGVTQWWPAIPYIYANNQWNPATAYIYANGHWNPQ